MAVDNRTLLADGQFKVASNNDMRRFMMCYGAHGLVIYVVDHLYLL